MIILIKSNLELIYIINIDKIIIKIYKNLVMIKI